MSLNSITCNSSFIFQKEGSRVLKEINCWRKQYSKGRYEDSNNETSRGGEQSALMRREHGSFHPLNYQKKTGIKTRLSSGTTGNHLFYTPHIARSNTQENVNTHALLHTAPPIRTLSFWPIRIKNQVSITTTTWRHCVPTPWCLYT